MTTNSSANPLIITTPDGATASIMLFNSGEHVGAVIGYKQGDIDVFDRVTGMVSEDSSVFSQQVILVCENYNEKYLQDPDYQFTTAQVQEVVGSWFDSVTNKYLDHIALNNQRAHASAAETLTNLRKEMGLSVEEIANRVSVLPEVIRDFERGDDVPLSVLRRYALAVHARMNIQIEKQY